MTHNSFNDLKGKVCVLTGGGGIIGHALALGLAEAGVKVAILYRNKENAEKVASDVREKTKGDVICVFGNVLDKNILIDAKKEINEKLGKIDFLINGAGGNDPMATTQLEFLGKENIGELSKGFFGFDIE